MAALAFSLPLAACDPLLHAAWCDYHPPSARSLFKGREYFLFFDNQNSSLPPNSAEEDEGRLEKMKVRTWTDNPRSRCIWSWRLKRISGWSFFFYPPESKDDSNHNNSIGSSPQWVFDCLLPSAFFHKLRGTVW
ncbi:hypothetical protein MTR_3g109928 [Medicago truncatula]|uniref:Transmembrane protein n=1 Tax=Medicago truncatula TaxID=3880 RepID=A0A072VCT9_MEDTR|nr:hypothetical protein MTR_3g109928 [Medicago truncatula]